jgi:hypothetical protein
MRRAVPGRPRMSVRLVRALALDGNPLRRASDRAEAWIRVGLLAVFLAAGPQTAVAAGHWAYPGTAARTSAEAAHVHPVRAVLVEPAAVADGPAVLGGGGQVWVRARWKSAGAPARTGEVLAPRGSPAGSVVTVWLDAAGRVTSPPPQPDRLGDDVALPVIMALVIEALALLAVLRLIKWFLNWRRLAAWEAAWSAIGPRWTGHRF